MELDQTGVIPADTEDPLPMGDTSIEVLIFQFGTFKSSPFYYFRRPRSEWIRPTRSALRLLTRSARVSFIFLLGGREIFGGGYM